MGCRGKDFNVDFIGHALGNCLDPPSTASLQHSHMRRCLSYTRFSSCLSNKLQRPLSRQCIIASPCSNEDDIIHMMIKGHPCHIQEKDFRPSSSNSPYTGQDLNASGGYNSSQQPAESSSKHQSTESYRSLERRLEREREKRTQGETLTNKVDTKVLPEESSPPAMDTRRNGFRLASHVKSPTASRSVDPSTASSGSYRTMSNRDALSSMGSLTVASTPSSAALRGHSIGFGSRDMSVRSPTQRSRTKGSMIMPMTVNDKLKNNRYQFVDPVPSASPSFQQRLSEIAALESDTIRYERTKRIKKRSKQESQ